MSGNHIVAVPASLADVRSFINDKRERFETDLSRVHSLIVRLRATEVTLRPIYKIYSRGSEHGTDELKSVRKIRLKFNDFNVRCGRSEASLFDVPDIVGLTIVVPNPSDISVVAAILDRVVESGDLQAEILGASDPGARITTRFGRGIESKGYVACHYNVRLRGVGLARPIVEIQIKTLLHDAWGAKTHDLTYKPTSRIGNALLDSFELLGESLAILDRQSDILRKSIDRASAVREEKRRRVQTFVLWDLSAANVELVSDVTLRTELEQIHAAVASFDGATPDELVEMWAKRLLEIFNDEPVASSSLLCFLGAMTQEKIYLEQAQDTITTREDQCLDELSRAEARFEAALAAFSAGDVGEAIDIAEEALRMACDADTNVPGSAQHLVKSLATELAYYYADIIGSHDGDKRNALLKARQYQTEAMKHLTSAGIPVGGVNAPDDEIIRALAHPEFGAERFQALDSQVYVIIQTSETEAEVREARERLDFLHSNVPDGLEDAATVAKDYHDYCARLRLTELERGLET